MIKVGIIGFGYRARYYLKAIKTLNDKIKLVCVYGRGEDKDEVEKLGIPYLTSIDEAIKYNVDFFINCSSKATIFDVSKSFLDRGQAVLQETPLTIHLDEIVNASYYLKNKRFQVCEQYPRYLVIRRIKELISSGKLGDIKELHISVAHEYHAAAIIKSLLNTTLEGFNMNMTRFESKVSETKSRYKHSFDGSIKKIRGMNILFSNDDLRIIYDFTSEEYRSTIRHPYIIIRGTRGELLGDKVFYLDENNKECLLEFDTSFNYEKEDLEAIALNLLNMIKYLEGDGIVYDNSEAIRDSYLSYIMNNHFNKEEVIDYSVINID